MIFLFTLSSHFCQLSFVNCEHTEHTHLQFTSHKSTTNKSWRETLKKKQSKTHSLLNLKASSVSLDYILCLCVFTVRLAGTIAENVYLFFVKIDTKSKRCKWRSSEAAMTSHSSSRGVILIH